MKLEGKTAIVTGGNHGIGKAVIQRLLDEGANGGVDPQIPATLVLFLASDAANHISGKFISSVWDNWKDFEKYIPEIEGTDVFTLRRIVPRARSMSWN